jgi:hypothetical protein
VVVDVGLGQHAVERVPVLRLHDHAVPDEHLGRAPLERRAQLGSLRPTLVGQLERLQLALAGRVQLVDQALREPELRVGDPPLLVAAGGGSSSGVAFPSAIADESRRRRPARAART